MKQLTPGEYPLDFHYHRTSSPTYRKYLENCWPTTFDTTVPDYAWRKSLFSGWCHVTRYERTDREPIVEEIKSAWVQHAMVTWIPYQRQDIPEWWRRLYLTDHFQNTGYTTIDSGDYTKHWNERAKRARKKFRASWAELRLVTPEEFVTAFQNTKVKHWYRSDYIRYYKKISAIDPSAIRQWLVYRDGKAVTGLAVLDYLGNHSVHLVAFTGKEAYDIQWGTGLIDEWFRDSQEKWMKYLTFDQLRNPHGPKEQKWYTEFKENFIEHKLTFPKAYFKIF
jgi:hypothetical protein